MQMCVRAEQMLLHLQAEAVALRHEEEEAEEAEEAALAAEGATMTTTRGAPRHDCAPERTLDILTNVDYF